MDAGTNYHQFMGLKQYKFIVSQVYRPAIQHKAQRAKIKGLAGCIPF